MNAKIVDSRNRSVSSILLKEVCDVDDEMIDSSNWLMMLQDACKSIKTNLPACPTIVVKGMQKDMEKRATQLAVAGRHRSLQAHYPGFNPPDGADCMSFSLMMRSKGKAKVFVSMMRRQEMNYETDTTISTYLRPRSYGCIHRPISSTSPFAIRAVSSSPRGVNLLVKRHKLTQTNQICPPTSTSITVTQSTWLCCQPLGRELLTEKDQAFLMVRSWNFPDPSHHPG
eukprot:scaffold8343_cov54-Cylindrotheca_fusiformis.AAC.1